MECEGFEVEDHLLEMEKDRRTIAKSLLFGSEK